MFLASEVAELQSNEVGKAPQKWHGHIKEEGQHSKPKNKNRDSEFINYIIVVTII